MCHFFFGSVRFFLFSTEKCHSNFVDGDTKTHAEIFPWGSILKTKVGFQPISGYLGTICTTYGLTNICTYLVSTLATDYQIQFDS